MSAHFTWQSAVLDSDCESSTKLVLLAIGSFMNQHGTGAFPSLETLSAKTSLSKLTVMRHVSTAAEKGWIKIQKRMTKNGDRDSNLYSVQYPNEVVSPVNHVVSPLNQGGIVAIPQVVSPVNRNTPVLTQQLTPQKEGAPEDGFDSFWKQYPNKKAKADALKAWKKIKPDAPLLAKILASLEIAKSSDGWKKDGGRFVPHPATWLNGRRWEDEATDDAKNDSNGPPSWMKIPEGARWVPGRGIVW